jgi:hypothetical protein
MLKRKQRLAEIGNQYVKAGDKAARIWLVVHIWTATDGIPHARLAQSCRPTELRTVALPVLNDPRYWQTRPS